MLHDPTKEGKEIFLQGSCKDARVTTGALKMRRYRKAEYIHHIVKEMAELITIKRVKLLQRCLKYLVQVEVL